MALAGCGGGDHDSDADRGKEPLPGARPNIVVVITDDQDAGSLRVMPSVRRLLADRGSTFAKNHASFPLCCPSRATFVTGQYAHNHGVMSNKPPTGGYQALRNRRRTLGVWLQRAGYRTGFVGKYLNGYGLDGDAAVPPGWSRWVVPMGLDELLMYGYRLNRDGAVRRYGNRARDYQTDVLAREATSFIRATGRKPFFLVLSTLAPHDELDTIDTGARDPRPAPRHYGTFADVRPPQAPSWDEADLSDKPTSVRRAARREVALDSEEFLAGYRGRLESLLAVDEAVKQLVATLRASGELDDTVIMFTSDNGYLLGEHGLVGKARPYEEATRVPLIVRGPGFPVGVNRALTANLDLAPTILALAGAEANRELDGISLVELARDPDAAPGRAIVIETESRVGLRTRRYFYLEHRKGERELYDMRRDPFQLENVAGDPAYGTVISSLAEALAALRECAGRECLAEVAEPEPG